MHFPERQTVKYIISFVRKDGEAVGITQDNRYVYILCNELRNNTELFEISHQEYFAYINAVQNHDEAALENFRADIYQAKTCIAYENSHYEPNPVNFVPYGSEIRQVYDDFITRHVVTNAEFSGDTAILRTKQGETLKLNFNQGGISNGK